MPAVTAPSFSSMGSQEPNLARSAAGWCANQLPNPKQTAVKPAAIHPLVRRERLKLDAFEAALALRLGLAFSVLGFDDFGFSEVTGGGVGEEAGLRAMMNLSKKRSLCQLATMANRRVRFRWQN